MFFDFTFRHGGASLPLRLVFALTCAVLPFLVAFILAHLFAKADQKLSTEKALSSFQGKRCCRPTSTAAQAGFFA